MFTKEPIILYTPLTSNNNLNTTPNTTRTHTHHTHTPSVSTILVAHIYSLCLRLSRLAHIVLFDIHYFLTFTITTTISTIISTLLYILRLAPTEFTLITTRVQNTLLYTIYTITFFFTGFYHTFLLPVLTFLIKIIKLLIKFITLPIIALFKALTYTKNLILKIIKFIFRPLIKLYNSEKVTQIRKYIALNNLTSTIVTIIIIITIILTITLFINLKKIRTAPAVKPYHRHSKTEQVQILPQEGLTTSNIPLEDDFSLTHKEFQALITSGDYFDKLHHINNEIFIMMTQYSDVYLRYSSAGGETDTTAQYNIYITDLESLWDEDDFNIKITVNEIANNIYKVWNKYNLDKKIIVMLESKDNPNYVWYTCEKEVHKKEIDRPENSEWL